MSGGMQRLYDETLTVLTHTADDETYAAMEQSQAALDAALGFELHCNQHGTTHPVSIRDAERLVYVLQGQLSDALTEPEDERQDKGEPGWKVAADLCPLESVRMADDLECYAEHVEAMLEARLDGAKR